MQKELYRGLLAKQKLRVMLISQVMLHIIFFVTNLLDLIETLKLRKIQFLEGVVLTSRVT